MYNKLFSLPFQQDIFRKKHSGIKKFLLFTFFSCIWLPLCGIIPRLFSAINNQGGASAWQNASFAIRALLLVLKSAILTDVPIVLGSPM
jgi:hypothetical protein